MYIRSKQYVGFVEVRLLLCQGYFGKIITTILARRPEQTLQMMHTKSVIPLLLNHLAASSILELLMKVEMNFLL
jgi:hypothetical protein